MEPTFYIIVILFYKERRLSFIIQDYILFKYVVSLEVSKQTTDCLGTFFHMLILSPWASKRYIVLALEVSFQLLYWPSFGGISKKFTFELFYTP